MTGSDSAFTGAIPELYDRYLGPTLFEPFAEDMAGRFRDFDGAMLETAAGTGRVTRALLRTVAPSASITATDLNEAMLTRAAELIPDPRIVWLPADAQDLPFEEGAFDAVVCQFGVMFFPDKAAGYSEARRVLTPGGRFVFNVWDRLEDNDLSRNAHEVVGELFPDDPPAFLPRTPFGYNDPDAIRRSLSDAGFADVEIETVARVTPAGSAGQLAMGMCLGSPLRAEIDARRPGQVEVVAQTVAAEMNRRFGDGPVEGKGQALVVTAVR